jgi:hypothetical protein
LSSSFAARLSPFARARRARLNALAPDLFCLVSKAETPALLLDANQISETCNLAFVGTSERLQRFQDANRSRLFATAPPPKTVKASQMLESSDTGFNFTATAKSLEEYFDVSTPHDKETRMGSAMQHQPLLLGCSHRSKYHCRERHVPRGDDI